jgi:cysteinyl-tRNA synthetase
VDGKVGMYVCGPTVQSDPHLGHGRFAVAFDVIRRYLRWRGFDVTYVRNITDVEDKIIAAAAETGETTEELATRVAERFAEAFEALGVLPPDHEPKATEHIDGMIADHRTSHRAWPGLSRENGDVYFSVRTLEGYGNCRAATRRAAFGRPGRSRRVQARPARLRVVEGGQAG